MAILWANWTVNKPASVVFVLGSEGCVHVRINSRQVFAFNQQETQHRDHKMFNQRIERYPNIAVFIQHIILLVSPCKLPPSPFDCIQSNASSWTTQHARRPHNFLHLVYRFISNLQMQRNGIFINRSSVSPASLAAVRTIYRALHWSICFASQPTKPDREKVKWFSCIVKNENAIANKKRHSAPTRLSLISQIETQLCTHNHNA